MDEKPDRNAVCARCGLAIDFADCYEIQGQSDDERAWLCRLEHVASWVIRGADWQYERPWEVPEAARSASGSLLVFRHRQGVALEQEFESADALKRWAMDGGYWRAAEGM